MAVLIEGGNKVIDARQALLGEPDLSVTKNDPAGLSEPTQRFAKSLQNIDTELGLKVLTSQPTQLQLQDKLAHQPFLDVEPIGPEEWHLPSMHELGVLAQGSCILMMYPLDIAER